MKKVLTIKIFLGLILIILNVRLNLNFQMDLQSIAIDIKYWFCCEYIIKHKQIVHTPFNCFLFEIFGFYEANKIAWLFNKIRSFKRKHSIITINFFLELISAYFVEIFFVPK